MSSVVGHVTQIMTRYLSVDILQSRSWESYIPVSEDSIAQKKFWLEHLDSVNFRNIFQAQICFIIIYSDASALGFAGYVVNTINGASHGQWSREKFRSLLHGENFSRFLQY